MTITDRFKTEGFLFYLYILSYTLSSFVTNHSKKKERLCAEKLKALPQSKSAPLFGMAAKTTRDKFTEEQVQNQKHSFGR